MDVPQKPVGKWYAVVMRALDFSLSRTAWVSALGGRDTFPSPDFGERCACCDRATTRRQPYEPYNYRVQIEAVLVPVCESCTDHIPRSSIAPQLFAIGIVLGLTVAALGLTSDIGAFTAAGLVVAIAVAGLAVARRRTRLRRAAAGHHAGFEVNVIARACTVRTTNRRLAVDVVARNLQWVRRVR